MNLKIFFKFVEINTKIASVFPFFLGSLYALFRFKSFNLINFFIMFISLIFFDMTTTAINNYIDFKKAVKNGSILKSDPMNDINIKTAFYTIITMLILATVFGILLFFRTNIIVLICGIISFAIGISYTYGPVPISRTPFGEIFSGVAMGFIIPFLSIYIHVWNNNLINWSYTKGTLGIFFNIPELIYIFLFSIPLIACIANIMLANNICDMEHDLKNKRNTLPIFIGKKYALYLFALIYICSYFGFTILVILKILPLFCLITILTFIFVIKNTKIFFKKHIKSETFVISIKNFLLINVVNVFLMIYCVILYRK